MLACQIRFGKSQPRLFQRIHSAEALALLRQNDHSGRILSVATSDDSVHASSHCRDNGFVPLQDVFIVSCALASCMFYELDRTAADTDRWLGC